MPHYDLVIRNGIVVDGSGAPPFRADIGVVGDTIARVGDLSGSTAEKVIDASGLVVAPGFIDIHNHSDTSVFLVPTADNYVMQGVTTIVVGNCGDSPAPLTERNIDAFKDSEKRLVEALGEIPWRTFSEYLNALDKLEKSINVATLVGHGTVRSAVLGFENVKPSARELNEMKTLVEEAMKAGAFGLSTGLIYVPSMFADTREIIELAKVVARYGGVYATHMRNEGVKLLDSVIEAITIGVESGAAVEISHLKASGIPAWGNVSRALAIIEDYVARGYDVSADAYPYTASSTSLSALLPSWVREGGVRKMLERLRDPSVIDRIEREFEEHGVMEERYLLWSQVVIAYSETHKEFEGMSIADIAEKLGLSPVKAVARILEDDGGRTTVVIHSMTEEDVIEAISHPLVAIGSDGSVKRFGEGKPHPRNYGTFPRVIARYVKELKVLSLPEAVRKMTSLPARKLGLWDRGLIRPGFKADIVVFNYYTIADTATYTNPHQFPKGIRYVIVNGSVVVDSGMHTGLKPGKLLRKVMY
jgi:N-acyl-D-amino-acid deacylase